MRSNGRSLVFYGTTEEWINRGNGSFDAVAKSGLYLEVEKVRVPDETIHYLGRVWGGVERDGDGAHCLDNTGGFHSPTLAMRETELLAKEHV